VLEGSCSVLYGEGERVGMSRLGKKPVPLPEGTEVNISGREVEIKGKKGVLMQRLPLGVSVKVQDRCLIVELDGGGGSLKSMHGLCRSLLNNAVIGVNEGFEKQLSLVGVGYRAAVKGDVLDLQLNFSHPSQLKIPPDLEVSVERNTLIKIRGLDKQRVGQFASNVRSKRPPEPYKGKGVRYVGERVRKKAGKAAKGK